MSTAILFGQNVEQYLREIQQGQSARAQAALPQLMQDYPNNPGVLYLQGVLESNGERAYEIFRNIANNMNENQYTDDAILKAGEYLYARGLYISAESYLRRIPMHYPNSPHIEQAANLLINSMSAAGKTDSSRVWAQVLQRQYPDITFAFRSDGAPAVTNTTEEPEEAAPPEPIDLSEENPYYNEEEEPATVNVMDGGFALQVGAFSSLENAEEGKKIFEENNYPVQIMRRNRNNVELYLVWVGGYETRARAEEIGDEIQQELGFPYFVVQTNNQ